jgi:alkylation response protein AidB-like acyl-CoA dehydrogenase
MSGERPTIRVVSGKQAVSAEEVIDRARALAPKLKERAAEAASLRRCPDQTIAELGEAGLTRVCQPLRYGGYELGWDVLCEVSQILAAACGAQGWVQRIFADHAHMLATFPAQAQEDVWAKDHGVFVSASFDPTGRARPVEGGFLFSGRHGFSSGIDHAGWMICGGFIEEDGKRDGPHFFLVPKSDATIIDDWQVMGLEGTGSKSFEVKEKFIPAHRFLDGRLARAGKGPGTEINASPLYRLPKGGGLTSTGFAALAVGMAKGLLEDWLDYTGPRKSRGLAVGAQQSMQILVAEAAAEIDAAEALYMGSIISAMKKLARGETIGAIELATAKRNVAFTCQMVLGAGTKLFNAAGGRALFTNNSMQRQYRNLLGAVSHHGVMWDQAATEFGAKLLQQHGAPRAERADVD